MRPARPPARISLWTRCAAAILAGALACGAAAIPARGQSQPPHGMPDSAEFGYGARMDAWGPAPEQAVDLAARIGLDWIGIEFDWARLWPDASTGVDLAPLNATVELARRHNLHLMISITHAPAWAMTPDGPDAQKTAMLVSLLAERYTGNLAAVELFPAANTRQGWGAAPNPAAYTTLLAAVAQSVALQGPGVTLIAGGLVPLDERSAAEDMDDLAFLQGLYASGALPVMPVISLQMPRLTGEPLEPSDGRPGVLRHYEPIRQVMLANGHDTGLIWITRFAWPAGLQNQPQAEQARWLQDALQLMRSQLYIGAALFAGLNPAGEPAGAGAALLQADGSLHPAAAALEEFISPGSANTESSFGTGLTKMLDAGPQKVTWKGRQS